MATTQPSTSFGFDGDEVRKILAKRCRIYYSIGAFSPEQTPLPDANDLEDLFRLSSPLFDPFGNMDENVGTIAWKQETAKIDFAEIPTRAEVTCTLNSVRFSEDFLAFLDSAVAKGELSLLFIPDDFDSDIWDESGPVFRYIFLALSGVTMTHEGNISLNGKPATVKLTFKRTCKRVTDCVLFKVFAE